jgi:Domain of unknown function (DUF6285)
MPDRPTQAELAEAVREFLEGEVLPLLDDHRLKFRTLVALNALGILQRELESPPAADDAAELAGRVRDEGASAELLPLLKRHVAAKLRVSNPRYLDRYEGGSDAP